MRFGADGSVVARGFGGRIETVWLVEATATPFHESKESVTRASPTVAESATRTGPSRLTPQQRCLSSNRSTIGAPPGLADGKAISATGLACSGIVSS
jgi:hypothetical protein